jgi:hypothetical protein
LGVVVSLIAVPQFLIFMLLFVLAKVIFPLTTPVMINDFKAAGGVLLLATGFRMLKLRNFPVADMIPAMILIMPVSWFWVNYILLLVSLAVRGRHPLFLIQHIYDERKKRPGFRRISLSGTLSSFNHVCKYEMSQDCRKNVPDVLQSVSTLNPPQ